MRRCRSDNEGTSPFAWTAHLNAHDERHQPFQCQGQGRADQWWRQRHWQDVCFPLTTPTCVSLTCRFHRIAAGYVAAGARVYISSRDAASLTATATELTSSGPGTCTALPADLSLYSGVESLVAALSAREKCLHVLVNNAGANWGAPLEEYPDKAFAKVLMLNTQRV